MIKNKIFKDAIALWGEPSQLHMLSEECAELIVAVSKINRNMGNFEEHVDNLFEEIADVKLMIDQITYMLKCKESVENYYDAKLLRLEGLVEGCKKSEQEGDA